MLDDFMATARILGTVLAVLAIVFLATMVGNAAISAIFWMMGIL